ncbi:MAG: 30S ribosomal protein S20 [Candidatus Peribacteraceae bacterium]|jgi:small subunit ribosomal protein S20
MPLIKSAIKRARQNTVRRQRLLPFRSSMKTMVRKVVDAAKAGNKAEAEKLLPAAFKAVDTAAKKRIIHRKTASRKKSLLSRLVAKL